MGSSTGGDSDEAIEGEIHGIIDAFFIQPGVELPSGVMTRVKATTPGTSIVGFFGLAEIYRVHGVVRDRTAPRACGCIK